MESAVENEEAVEVAADEVLEIVEKNVVCLLIFDIIFIILTHSS